MPSADCSWLIVRAPIRKEKDEDADSKKGIFTILQHFDFPLDPIVEPLENHLCS